MEKTILVATPDLRPSLQSVLKGMVEAGLVGRVVTTVAFDSRSRAGRIWLRLAGRMGHWWRKGVYRRRLPAELEGLTVCLPWRELARLSAAALRLPGLEHRIWKWAERGFDRQVAKRYGGSYRCAYGMEHASLETFRAQKEAGGLCALRQVSPHARTIRALLEREAGLHPGATDDYSRLLASEIGEMTARKEAEYAMADLVVANSDYVRQTFLDAGFPESRIVAVPTGCPAVEGAPARPGEGVGPLRFLFAGTVSLRKGAPVLLEAWKQLDAAGRAELRLAGRMQMSSADFRNLPAGAFALGPLSSLELDDLYRRSDALVLPTLGEGLAHVVLEALSRGLPVITTAESGCGRLVEDGVNGRIVAAGDAGALRAALEEFVSRRHELARLGRASLEKAKRWTISDSNREHLKIMKDFLAH